MILWQGFFTPIKLEINVLYKISSHGKKGAVKRDTCFLFICEATGGCCETLGGGKVLCVLSGGFVFM